MTDYALIKDGKVINTIVYDGVSKYTPPKGTQVIELAEGAGIGWDYDKKLGFVDNRPKPEPLPEEPREPTIAEKYDALVEVLKEKELVTTAELDSKLTKESVDVIKR